MTQIKVLLVDDSREFLQAAAQFLSSDPCIEVVGRVESAEDALREATRLEPDLVLVDLAMPGMNGLEATRHLKERKDPPRVIILTMYDLDEYRSAAPAVQADGFVTKSEFGIRLLPMIHTIFRLPKPNLRSGEKQC
jgi:DNA-binding NarL/FixJ family response regulator